MAKKLQRLLVFLLILVAVPIKAKANEFENPQLIKNQIEGYYRESYDIYLNMEMKPMDKYLDYDQVQNRNKLTVLQRVIDTWKYSTEKKYMKDDRERYPLYFTYKSINIDISNSEATVVVDINGEHTEKNEAYPMFVSFGENKFKLKLKNENWVLVEHDYSDPGFQLSKTELIEYSRDDNIKNIDNENKTSINLDEKGAEVIDRANPYTDISYNRSRAVSYANSYANTGNTYFYIVSGNDCTNFISQCIAYGFGSTTGYSSNSSYRQVLGKWSAGSGGGYPEWENVSRNWNYMTSSKSSNDEGPRVNVVTWSALLDGGIMQIDFPNEIGYDHSVICVSKSTGKFAQHTSNGFRYYNDYDGTKRFYQPSYFREF